MADRRMLSRAITDHDNFISLSASAQALYMHLCMSADDDGFCNQVSLAMFKAHSGSQDLEALIQKKYLIQFDNGVIVIKHWRMQNSLRKDRYKPTAYQEEKSQIVEKPNGSYTLATKWQPAGNQVATNGCRSIGKDSIGKNNSSSKRAVDFTDLLSIDELQSLYDIYEDANALIDECESDANKKKKHIDLPYEYIIGYATNRGWPEKE